MSLVRRLAVGIAVVALMAAPPAADAADWRDGGLITDIGKQAQPVRAVADGNGNAAFSWSGYVEEGSRPYVSHRPAGGSLTAQRRLSDEYASILPFANAEGDLLLVSKEPVSDHRRLVVRAGTVAGPVGPVQPIFEGGDNERVCEFSAAVGPGGRALVVYGVSPPWEPSPVNYDADRCSLRARVRPTRDAPFGPEMRLSDPARVEAIQARFDAGGRALVAWTQPMASTIDASIRAVRIDPVTGPSAQQEVAVPGETPSIQTRPRLRVSANGRALIAFASRRPGGSGSHVAAANGDTASGFTPAEVMSGPAILQANYGSDVDAAIGDDGTVSVVWRAGREASAKVQGAVAGPAEPLDATRTETLSRAQARGPRVTVGAGRATFAWFRLVPGAGRSIESRFARPGDGYSRVQRLSTREVTPRPPQVESARSGAAWITWGARPDSTTAFAVLEARKLTVQTQRYSRILDILRARTNLDELIASYDLVALPGDAMLAVVLRQRPGSGQFWQLRTYGE